MARITDITKPRLFQSCCAQIRRSTAIRLFVAVELQGLKFARRLVDSRIRKMRQSNDAQERQSKEP